VPKRRRGVLHDFDRTSDAIEEEWREMVSDAEIKTMDELVAPIWATLEDRQLRLPGQVSA
jgi:hypothetical protein